MGSCISSLFDNIFREDIESTAIDSFHDLPRLWIRYVDGIFCVIKPDNVDNFLKHLNKMCDSIKFTVEFETNGILPCSDVSVKRYTENNLITTVYHKHTHYSIFTV